MTETAMPADAKAAADPGATRIPVAAWWILGLMTVEYVLAMIDRNAVSILKTTLKQVFGASDKDYGLLVSAFLIPYAIFYVINGRLVDRFGSRIMLTVFAGIWSLATIGTALAQSWTELVILRVILGAAEAGLVPATVYAMVTWFPADKYATVYAIKTPLQSLGAILSPPVVVALTLWYGWRAAFIVPATLGLIFAALWWFSDRNPPTYATAAVSPPVASERTTIRALLSTRTIWGLMILRFISDPVWFFFQNWQAGYLQDKLGASLADVGQLLWMPPLATAMLSFLTAYMSDRMVRKGTTPLRARLRVMQASAIFAPLIILIPLYDSVPLFLVVVTTSYFMGYTWLYLSNVLVAGVFPRTQVGLAIGLVNFAGTVGAAIFNYGAGFVIADYGYLPVFFACAALHPLTALFVQLFYHRELQVSGGARLAPAG